MAEQTVAQALTPPRLTLPEYDFTVPPKSRQWKTDPEIFTLRSYTLATEDDAMEAAKTMNKLGYELFQRMVLTVDGKPVDQGVGRVLDTWSPKCRALALTAVNLVGVPDEESERAPFLASVVVRLP